MTNKEFGPQATQCIEGCQNYRDSSVPISSTNENEETSIPRLLVGKSGSKHIEIIDYEFCTSRVSG